MANTAQIGKRDRKQPSLTKRDIKPLNDLIYGLVVVLFLGFAAMFVAVGQMITDSWNNKQSTYQDLRDKVLEQNYKIDQLTQQVKDLNNKQ